MVVAEAGDMWPKRWHQLDGDEQGQAVMAIVRDLQNRTGGKGRHRSLQLLELFEGRALGSLDAWAYSTSWTDPELGWQIPRRMLLALQAKVAGSVRPKPQFTVRDADWKTKRRARKLGQFVDAVLQQPQGTWGDAWEQGEDLLLDCGVWGLADSYVFGDTAEKKIVIERVLQHELLVDPREAASQGTVRNLFWARNYDKDKLASYYPEKSKEILEAGTDGNELAMASHMSRDVSDQCLVVDAYYLGTGGEPGVFCRVVGTTVLESMPWERGTFPHAMMRWVRDRIGWYARGALEDIASTDAEIRRQANRMKEATKLATPVILAPKNSMDDEELTSNELFTVIHYDAREGAASFHAPPAFTAQDMQWIEYNMSQIRETFGLSEMATAATKPAGIDSAIGLRTLNDIQSERFAVIFKQYERYYVQLARCIVAAARDMAENDKDFAVNWPGRRFIKTIKWSDVDLADDMFTVQIESVSAVGLTQAGRVSTAQDLFNAGILSKDAFLRIVQMGDLEREMSSTQAQHDWLEDLIDEMLDATPEAQDDGDYQFKSPEPFLVMPLAIAQVGQAYMQAAMDGAPDFNLELLRVFITQCDANLQKQTAAMAETAQQAGGMGLVNQQTPQVAPTGPQQAIGAAA